MPPSGKRQLGDDRLVALIPGEHERRTDGAADVRRIAGDVVCRDDLHRITPAEKSDLRYELVDQRRHSRRISLRRDSILEAPRGVAESSRGIDPDRSRVDA